MAEESESESRVQAFQDGALEREEQAFASTAAEMASAASSPIIAWAYSAAVAAAKCPRSYLAISTFGTSFHGESSRNQLNQIATSCINWHLEIVDHPFDELWLSKVYQRKYGRLAIA